MSYLQGSYPDRDGVTFVLLSDAADCEVLLYDKQGKTLTERHSFAKGQRYGAVQMLHLPGVKSSRISYTFSCGGIEVEDPLAKGFLKLSDGGVRKAVFPDFSYDWQGDRHVRHPFEDSIWYQLHVKGFTASASSHVKKRGTLAGLREKIPYLKELGVNTLCLQPIYDFEETITDKNQQEVVTGKTNYWGYAPGRYFVPKPSYIGTGDAVKEICDLVRDLHAADMEVILQFYFDKDAPEAMILAVLHYWVLNYHIDGFHLVGEQIPMGGLSMDPLLAETKLLCDHLEGVPGLGGASYDYTKQRRIGLYQEDYQYPARRLLKGDEGTLASFLGIQKAEPAGYGRINYLTSYRGFTMADLVSYDKKHNEENGEENRDGSNYNFSWNCGEEGPTRKAKVLALREQQLRNAFFLLMTSAGTPMFFMGDEFGNSQKGNNNPYCIDSKVTWLDWKDQEKNAALYTFVKEMIAFRKAHPILHTGRELSMLDADHTGFPDLSYHGESAWRAAMDHYSRTVGILYCENYAGGEAVRKKSEPALLYLALNLYWKDQNLALPKAPKGYVWKGVFSTIPGEEAPEVSADLTLRMPPRTIGVYRLEAAPVKNTKSK